MGNLEEIIEKIKETQEGHWKDWEYNYHKEQNTHEEANSYNDSTTTIVDSSDVYEEYER